MVVLLAVLVIIVDQVTKAVLLRGAVGNGGIAFGIANQHSLFVGILLGIGLIGSVYLYRTSTSTRYSQAIWGCIFGGIVSNLIDRVRIGSVVDPFTIPWLQISLNIADVAISIGFAIICLQLLARERARRRALL